MNEEFLNQKTKLVNKDSVDWLGERRAKYLIPLRDDQAQEIRNLTEIQDSDFGMFIQTIERHLYFYRLGEQRKMAGGAKTVVARMRSISKKGSSILDNLDSSHTASNESLLEAMYELGIDEPEEIIARCEADLPILVAAASRASQKRVGRENVRSENERRLVAKFVYSCFQMKILTPEPTITPVGRQLMCCVLNVVGYGSSDPRDCINEGYRAALEYVASSKKDFL